MRANLLVWFFPRRTQPCQSHTYTSAFFVPMSEGLIGSAWAVIPHLVSAMKQTAEGETYRCEGVP